MITYPLLVVSSIAGSPSGLRICNAEGGGGCCTAAIESRLLEASHQFMERQTRDALAKWATVLSKRAQKFNGELVGGPGQVIGSGLCRWVWNGSTIYGQ